MEDQEFKSILCDIAVAGVGPVGLLLAGELATQGIRTIVLERNEVPSLYPKANGIVGHSAAELAKRGILAGKGLRVFSPRRFQFGPLELNLGFGPGNPLHVMPLPQRRLEQLLEEYAVRQGAEVLRGREVIGLSQRAEEIQIELQGEDRPVRASYLVGCDGAHSTVRKISGIPFTGFTDDNLARVARVTIPRDLIRRRGDSFEIARVGRVTRLRPNRFPGGEFTIAPLALLDKSAARDEYLVSTRESRGEERPGASITVEELRSSLRRVLGADLPFTAASALRRTVPQSRQAEKYRVGRVYLAGDAAHVFNAGGSALNVGLQDALHLAQHLGVLLSHEPAGYTADSYEAVRRPAGEAALRHTRAQAALEKKGNEDLRLILGGLLRNRRTSRRLARLLENG